ncbi:MAG: entericidin [Gluconacetobacter diazotrophicus]|nr:entericidin [Gluconacetobacter diazotrophicus]
MSLKSCRIVATLGLLAGASLGLAACNTVAGIGQDTSALGKDVTGGAGATQHAVTGSTGLATH